MFRMFFDYYNLKGINVKNMDNMFNFHLNLKKIKN